MTIDYFLSGQGKHFHFDMLNSDREKSDSSVTAFYIYSLYYPCAVLQCCRLPIVLMSAVWFPSAALWGCRLSVSILQHCSQLSGWRAHTALQHCSTLHTPINILTHFCLDLTRDAAPPSPQRRAAGGWWLPGHNLQLQCCSAAGPVRRRPQRFCISLGYISTNVWSRSGLDATNKRTINIFPHTSNAALQSCSEQCCCVSAHRVPIMLQCCSAAKHRASRGGNINQIQTTIHHHHFMF